jgi:hypothetical protein
VPWGPGAAAGTPRQQRAAAEAARQRRGPQRRGTGPQPGPETPDDQAQPHVTAPEWQRMRPNTTGGEDGGKAPVRVAAADQSIVAGDVTAASHDHQPAAPLAPLTVAPRGQAGIARPTDSRGLGQRLPAPSDRGSSREAAASAVAPEGGAPSMAPGRQRHPAPEAEVPEPPVTAPDRMAATVPTPAGGAVDARRTGSVAPGVGQRTEARGVRRLLLRGLAPLRGEWRLVCLPHHLRKLGRYACAPSTV